jgi:DNA-binding NarL/FixJ family response regulator
LAADVRGTHAIELPDGSIQALILERHAVSRLGFGVLLHRQPWIGRCLLASRREEAVTLLRRAKPDVAIVDVTDAGPFLTSYLAPLRSAHAGIAMLLSVRNNVSLARFARLSGGSSRLLSPELTTDEVVAAVRLAVVGEREAAVPYPTDEEPPAEGVLSGREQEVLVLLSTGATNQEIAATMHISPATVKKHTAALYRKLGVRNRTEAAHLARELAAA